MVSFTALVTVATLCATLAQAAPLPGKGAHATPTSVPCTSTTQVKPTTTPCTTTTSMKMKPTTTKKAKKPKKTTSCSSSSKSKSKKKKTKTKKAKPTTTPCTTTSTSTSMLTYSTPSYGSGMSSWGKGGGYNDCVQQCILKNGGMKMGHYQKPTATMQSYGSTGKGATHTVIVAPSQGVLRYVPMAVNASVGDTIKFIWGANNHTVTKGSQLEPCNKTKDALFTSGSQNKGFVFTQVVNDTKPTFFFCNTPGHCQKGMFGIINPANNFGAPSCAKKMMPKMMKNSSNLASMYAYMDMMETKTPAAMNWGNNLDLDAVPDWAQESYGENIMFTRSFLAANPDVMDKNGKVNLGNAGDAPFVIPKDLSTSPRVFAAVANSAQNVPVFAASSAAQLVQAAATSTVTLVSATPSPSPVSTQKKSSAAISARSPAGAMGIVVTVVAFMML